MGSEISSQDPKIYCGTYGRSQGSSVYNDKFEKEAMSLSANIAADIRMYDSSSS